MKSTNVSRYLVVSGFLLAVFAGACSRDAAPPPDAGTIPATQDRDGDGLPDDWERDGVDYTDPRDGSKQHLDLKSLGASPNHRDIVVWVEWMTTASHSHKPEAGAIKLVEDAFRSAPLMNTDGFQGINVHLIVRPSGIDEKTQLGTGRYSWGEFDGLKAKYFPPDFGNTVFFCVFAHDITPEHNSGIAKTIPGRDLIVSLGAFTKNVGTREEKAGTLMHELGHALGLHHGGGDDVQAKPNYLTVMNYSFQLNGLTISGRPGTFDYSRFALDAPEPTLDETIGLSTDPRLAKYGTSFYCLPNGIPQYAPSIAGTAIDWNCDGAYSHSVTADINADGSRTRLAGQNDWDKLVLKTSASAGVTVANVSGVTPDQELTPSRADTIPLTPVPDVHARKIGNGVLIEWTPLTLERVLAYRVYRAANKTTQQVAIATVGNTANPSYADVNVTAGDYSYTVTALFAPHAAQPEVPAPPPPPPTGQRPPSLGGTWITSGQQIEVIRDAASSSATALETLGNTVAPESREKTPFFNALRETAQSSPASVVVK